MSKEPNFETNIQEIIKEFEENPKEMAGEILDLRGKNQELSDRVAELEEGGGEAIPEDF